MKKKAIIIVVVILLLAGAGVGAWFYFNNSDESGSGSSSSKGGQAKEQVKVTPSANKTIEYERYDNGLVSFDYPKGWQVEIAPADYIHYSFKIYNPADPDYALIYAMKFEGPLKTEKARSVYASMYPDTVFAKAAAIDPQTAEGFYKVWDKNLKLANESLGGVKYFPLSTNFNVIEKIGKDILGGDILRATFTSESGKTCEGLFTADVKAIGTYYISENIMNPLGPQVDVSPLNIYNIIQMYTPEGEFNEWQGILDHCLSTVQFSNQFISGFNDEENTLVKTVQSNQQIYNQMSDMIMDSWNKRSASYDIMSQKQSDATLGYERVYDTTTGDIYKATNGFTDYDWNGKYAPVTDDMYTQPISGYIEKVN